MRSAGSTLIRSSVGASARGARHAARRSSGGWSRIPGCPACSRCAAAVRHAERGLSQQQAVVRGGRKHAPAVGLLGDATNSRTRGRSPTATGQSRSARAPCRGRRRRCSRPRVRIGSTSSSKLTSPCTNVAAAVASAFAGSVRLSANDHNCRSTGGNQQQQLAGKGDAASRTSQAGRHGGRDIAGQPII